MHGKRYYIMLYLYIITLIYCRNRISKGLYKFMLDSRFDEISGKYRKVVITVTFLELL